MQYEESYMKTASPDSAIPKSNYFDKWTDQPEAKWFLFRLLSQIIQDCLVPWPFYNELVTVPQSNLDNWYQNKPISNFIKSAAISGFYNTYNINQSSSFHICALLLCPPTTEIFFFNLSANVLWQPFPLD